MPLHPFPQTRWSVVLSAKGQESEGSSKAMENPALACWKPVYFWLRSQGHSDDQARDETQGFFAYLLSRDFLKNIQPAASSWG